MKPGRNAIAICLSMGFLTAAAAGYRISSKQEVGGPVGWDYVTVDAAARRVYIAHSTQVDVLDADSYAKVGVVPDVAGAHGVAIAPEVNRGFATAGKANAVVVFDTKTLKPITQVKVGQKPDAIVYDSASKRVFAMNGDGESATAINAADGTVAGTVPLGGGPEFTVVDGQGKLYVNLEDQSQLLQIDTKELKVVNRWPVAPCQQPSSLAMDRASHRLFLGCRSRVMAVVDADSGKVVANYPIGDHVDASAYDPATKLVYHSTGDGNVYVFRQKSPDAYELSDTITTMKGAKTMGLDAKTGTVFVPANDNGKFVVLVLSR